MRHRAPYLCILALMFALLAGCDTTGIPDPAGRSATATAQPTPSQVARLDPDPTATTSRPRNTPTTRPAATSTPQAEDTEEPEATPEPEETAGPDNTPAPVGTVSADILEQVDQIWEDTADFRELDRKEDVPETFITEDELRANLTKELEEDYTPEEAARDAMEIWLMRLSPERDLDLYQLYIDLQTEQVLGYYDQIENELFVRNDGSELTPSIEQTLAHEFVHALQDQHYALEDLIPAETTDDDRSLAVRSLVEGDATVSGLFYAQTYMTPEEYQSLIDESANADTTVLDSSPRYIRDSLYFPYEQGLEFVIALGILTGFDPINEALADPPASTEQIIHPEKYMDAERDLPKPVELTPLTDTLGTGWTYNDYATYGEFDLRILLEENGAVDGEGGAAGWGGGMYEYYQNGDDGLLLITTVWDTRRDADEFEDALIETFNPNSEEDGIYPDPDGERYFAIKRTDDKITLLASTDPEALRRAVAAVK